MDCERLTMDSTVSEKKQLGEEEKEDRWRWF